MTIPDKLITSCSWEELCIYIFIKKSKDKVSYNDLVKEFKLPRTTIRHRVERLSKIGAFGTTVGTTVGTPNGTTKILESKKLDGAFGTPNGTLVGTPNGTVESRKKDFYNSLIPYVEKYGKQVVRDFYNYWSETKGENGKKMRCEMQPTFQIANRLATWHRNNFNTNKSDIGVVFHGNDKDAYDDFPNT